MNAIHTVSGVEKNCQQTGCDEGMEEMEIEYRRLSGPVSINSTIKNEKSRQP